MESYGIECIETTIAGAAVKQPRYKRPDCVQGCSILKKQYLKCLISVKMKSGIKMLRRRLSLIIVISMFICLTFSLQTVSHAATGYYVDGSNGNDLNHWQGCTIWTDFGLKWSAFDTTVTSSSL